MKWKLIVGLLAAPSLEMAVVYGVNLQFTNIVETQARGFVWRSASGGQGRRRSFNYGYIRLLLRCEDLCCAFTAKLRSEVHSYCWCWGHAGVKISYLQTNRKFIDSCGSI